MNWGVLVGGVVLGIGWAVSGFCPGTGVVAVGGGRKDAAFFVLGGLVGAGLFIFLYGPLAETGLFKSIAGGKITLVKTEKFDAIINSVNGAVIAIAIGVVMILAAWRLPKSIR